MFNRSQILSDIGKPDGKASVVVKFHTTGDIIRQMQTAHYDNSAFAQKIAYRFRSGSVKSTCRNIYRFLKSNIEYRIEPAHLQTTKSLQRLIADGYGDCKHYSGFFAAILSALNIKHHYRFASYKSDGIPTHVYVIAYDERGREIKCDAVLPTFDIEKKFTHKIDKNMLMHLSGIGDLDAIGAQGKGKAKVKAAVKKVKTKAKAAVKKVAKKAASVAKKVVRGGKTIGLATPRTAFLGLLRINVRGMATKVHKAIQRNPNKVKSIWNKLGGNFTTLQQVAKLGAAKKQIFGLNDEYVGSATAAAATLAAAAPIIVAIMPVIKSILPASDQAGIDQAVSDAGSAFQAAEGIAVNAVAYKPQAEAGVSPQSAASSDGSLVTKSDMEQSGSSDASSTSDESKSTGSGIDTKTLVIVGAAGVALLMFAKK